MNNRFVHILFLSFLFTAFLYFSFMYLDPKVTPVILGSEILTAFVILGAVFGPLLLMVSLMMGDMIVGFSWDIDPGLILGYGYLIDLSVFLSYMTTNQLRCMSKYTFIWAAFSVAFIILLSVFLSRHTVDKVEDIIAGIKRRKAEREAKRPRFSRSF